MKPVPPQQIEAIREIMLKMGEAMARMAEQIRPTLVKMHDANPR